MGCEQMNADRRRSTSRETHWRAGACIQSACICVHLRPIPSSAL
jgi:hypothetical protein